MAVKASRGSVAPTGQSTRKQGQLGVVSASRGAVAPAGVSEQAKKQQEDTAVDKQEKESQSQEPKPSSRSEDRKAEDGGKQEAKSQGFGRELPGASMAGKRREATVMYDARFPSQTQVVVSDQLIDKATGRVTNVVVERKSTSEVESELQERVSKAQKEDSGRQSARRGAAMGPGAGPV